MFRNRLKGGHRVGASTYQQNSQGQSAPVQPSGGWGRPPPQPYPTPMTPGQPPPQQPVQLQQAPNAAGWGNENADNSWNWGETDPWSNNSNQGFTSQQQLNQQHQLNQQQNSHALSQQPSQPPVPQYNHPPQAYPQQPLQLTSQQQQFAKPSTNAVHNNQHAVNNAAVYAPSQHQQFSAGSQPQYVNGNSQNGNDDWGNDNWGDDWSQNEANKNNNKPANYGRQEQHYNQQPQQQQQYQTQQQQQYHTQQQYQQQQQHSQLQQNYPHDAYSNLQQQQQLQYEQQQKQEQQYKEQQEHNIQQSQQYPVDQQNYYQQPYQQYNSESNAVQQHNDQQKPAVEQQQQPSVEQQQQQPSVEQQLQQQQGPMQPAPATEADAWGWGNEDWDAARKEEQSHSTYEHQQLQQQPMMALQPEGSAPPNASTQEISQETPADHGLSSFANDLSQKAVNRDTAGDGWPDWESGDQQHQQQQTLEVTHVAEQPVAPTGLERMPAQQEDHGQSYQMHQGSHQWDDGLEHKKEAGNDIDTAAVTSAEVTSHHTAVPESGQESSSSEIASTHIKQDSWGWDTSEMEVRLDEHPHNAQVSMNDAMVTSESSVVQHDNLQAHTQLSEQISPEERDATSTAQHDLETSTAGISSNEEVSAPTAAVPGPAVGETWDDDGWGDGWEAESSTIQEVGTSEKNLKTEEHSGEHQQHQDSLQPPANFNSAHQLPDVSETLNHPPAEAGHAHDDVDIQQQSYQQETAVSEGYQYGQEKVIERPHDVAQQEGSGWVNSWNEDIPVDPSSKHAQSSEVMESVAQENTEQPSSAYDHYGHTGMGESVAQPQHIEDPYQYSGYHMQQPGVYHMPQGEAQAHLHWPTNQARSEQGNESQHNVQCPSIVEKTNRAEHNEELLNVHSQSGHGVSLAPEKANSHTRLTPSPHPPAVPNPQTDHNHYSHPEPVPSPHTSAPEAVSAEGSEGHHIPLQDSAYHYSSYQANQHHVYHQYQGLNQEVIDEPEQPTSELPDPMVSRIPDGASSVSEMSASNAAAADIGSHIMEEPQGDFRHSSSEMLDRPSSTQSAHSVTSQPALVPSQPVRPPSTHSYPERPASNQSAHSVHSVRSSHSVHSAYSNRSTQSSHSLLGQNQEVPSGEEVKMTTPQSNTFQAVPHDLAADSLPSGNVQNANSKAAPPSLPADGSIDPTAPPANNPVAPPPKSGPLGSVSNSNFRVRKSSPFQPPLGKPPQTQPFSTPRANSSFSDDVSANLEMPPDNNEQPLSAERNAVPLWTSSENLTSNVKLAVAAPSIETAPPVQSSQEANPGMSDASVSIPSTTVNNVPSVPNNPIPLVVPGMMKEEHPEMEPSSATVNPPQATWNQPDPPVAHNIHSQSSVVLPKMQSQLNTAPAAATPGVLDLSRSSRSLNEPRGDGSQNKTETPNFSRMVPGESSKGESASSSTYQAPSVVPSMPSERVVTGNDNPQPVLPVRIKQEPAEVRSPPDGPYTSDLSGQGASVVPPIRSETIGSEEPTSRNFTSANSGSRPDLTNEHRSDRGGRWERDHSRDRDSRSGDRYRERSREHSRDYYRDDSPHSRRSYDRDYDYKYDSDRRMWRHESEDDEDGDRRYYESRDRRDRAYRDELDRYSDRPVKEEKDRSHRESSRDKRRDYRDRSRDYRSYDDDPYFGRNDRSQPVSRSSSINNLDNEGDRSGHSHRSRHDYYDRHDRRDSRSRDSDHRDRDGPYSRNHRDRDSSYGQDGREGRDPRRDPRYYGQRGYDDSYGSRELYDQYHYYYQYYQGHPYYKEYYRQWMKQYGHAYQSHESFYDDRTSIHSGRSSVNDELKKSISSPRAAYDPYGYYYGHATQPPHSSSQFMQDFHGRSSVGAYEPSAIYPDGSYSQLKSYASGELSGVPSVGGDSASEAPQRLTPVQHGLPHINARFTPGGQLLLVLPKDPRDGEKAVVQIRDVQKMLSIDASLNRSIWQMKSYPGPLTLADTHKDVVVRYCEQQAAGAAKNQALPDGESVTLIWEYLALLVKQNGKLYGSDVAGLLLKGQDRLSQPQHSASHSSPEDDAAEVSSSDGSPQDEGIDMQLQSTPVPPPRDEVALLKKFTEYLCLGRKKEAVDYAMREGLWGHALALSYKMDSTTHTRVLAAFSNSLPRNDVLLTLFQQLSGKRPEVAKNYTPQQWGNWRQHLAMMVSNPTGQSQRDKASVVALGETLASRGQLHAAHFCYLVAETEWGSFSNKESKLVLIGSSHNLPFQAFATNEAIQCTEIYEFARSLEPSNPVLEKFQSYKLIYALRLAEFGFPSEALRYCEVISQIVSKDPHTYQGDFLAQVYELGLRLKYHDLHYQMYEGEVAEIPDPQWLTNLASLVVIVRQQEAEQAPSQSTKEYQSNTQDYSSANTYQGSSATPDLYSQNMQTTTDSYSLGYSGVDTSHQQGQATPDLSKGHPVSADAMDGGYHQQLIPTYPLASGTPNEGPAAQVMQSESGQSVESTSHIQESSSPHPENVPMMMQPQNQSQYGGYGSNYWPGYTQPDVNASSSYVSRVRRCVTLKPSSLSWSASPSCFRSRYVGRDDAVPSITVNAYTADSEVSSEQRSNSATSMTQPNSLGSYPPYQQPYQPWDQQHQHPGSSIDADQPQSSSPESPQNSGAQRTAEEEAYWAEMTGKKDDEYDEFGGDLYEYEDIEEVGARESDTDVEYQLRHRHPTSLVSNQEPLAVTSTIPTSLQQPPSHQPFEPSESVQDSLSQIPECLGSTTTTTATLSPSLESSTSSMALPNSLPMFQPLPQHSPLLSSPLPPPLGLNSHVTQTSNDMAEPTSKENENSEDGQKNKEKNPDPSQEKSTGWSIGSLFRWKTNTKQAVLPDDKNPSIVWNEEKKRWENKDGEEELNNPPPPPPKSATGGPGAPPPMFLARAGPRKSRYVNTEKDSSKQPLNGPNPMLNPLGGNPPIPGGPMPIPSGAPTPPSFMVPGPASEGSSSSQQPPNMQPMEQQQPPQQPLPQVPPTSLPDSSLMRRSRYISESSIELEEDWPPTNPEGTSSDGAEGPVPMMAPPGQPQFFNPSQFNPTASSNPAQTKSRPGKEIVPRETMKKTLM
ncbi:protein transport protein Sec16A-like [Macrobrachium nipponense]|uniref:protein transport protein Sec16A-like n=1 Tax=Macrobrachium nipponense TaxID=159736 RepID=UPI0030C7CF0F